MNHNEAFSSTGASGVTRRMDNRIYVNSNRYSPDATEILFNFGRLLRIGDRSPQIGRVVFRGIVSEATMSAIQATAARRNLEAALPLSLIDRPGWLVYMGQNFGDRRQLASTEEIMAETAAETYRAQNPPLDKVEAAISEGFSFTDRIEFEDIGRALELWADVFGWSPNDICQLVWDMDQQEENEPHQKTTWISGIRDSDGVLICLAMAELLPMPSADGQVSLIECTEWSTDPIYGGRGLMTANLAYLNAQILHDMQDSPNGLPLIFAECSFQARSDRAGYGAGFRIPERNVNGAFIPQLLPQNVHVNDGIEGLENKLRDFNIMYLPVESIAAGYRPEQIADIIQTAENTFWVR